MCPRCYYNVTETRFLLFVKARVPAHCLHSIRQTGGPFTPPPPQVVHSSRVNIIYGVGSCFFHPDPKNERAHSLFPASLVGSYCHISFPVLSLTKAWTERRNSFHLPLLPPPPPPFLRARNKVLRPRSHSLKFFLIIVWETAGVGGGGGGCLSRAHMAHMSQPRTHGSHVLGVPVQFDCSVQSSPHWQQSAGDRDSQVSRASGVRYFKFKTKELITVVVAWNRP